MARAGTAESKTGRPASPKLSLDEVLAFIRQLDAAARSQVAQILAESEIDARLGALIRRLARKPAVADISDREIQAEIDAVRVARVRTPC